MIYSAHIRIIKRTHTTLTSVLRLMLSCQHGHSTAHCLRLSNCKRLNKTESPRSWRLAWGVEWVALNSIDSFDQTKRGIACLTITKQTDK